VKINRPSTSTPTARARAIPARAAGAPCSNTTARNASSSAASSPTTNNRMELTRGDRGAQRA
jgi:hypothetical protein